ncbi:MAG: hypothetical protein GY854_04135, partial [Deltaproteobacteria bacterium]|nr:hypothetical protein [Deltaproteobacteria bacterium]
ETPPAVDEVVLRDGHLEVTLSEEPDMSLVGSAFLVDEGAISWTLEDDTYTVRSEAPLPAGEHTLRINTGAPFDLAGKGLEEPFETQVSVEEGTDNTEVYFRPDTRLVDLESLANRFTFHGRPVDLETGLYYFRNRYFDPELGRFITEDPLGYVDGPSMYQFAGYSPFNYSDSMGLCGEFLGISSYPGPCRWYADRAAKSVGEGILWAAGNAARLPELITYGLSWGFFEGSPPALFNPPELRDPSPDERALAHLFGHFAVSPMRTGEATGNYLALWEQVLLPPNRLTPEQRAEYLNQSEEKLAYAGLELASVTLVVYTGATTARNFTAFGTQELSVGLEEGSSGAHFFTARRGGVVPRGTPRLLGPGTRFGAKIEGQLAKRGWTKRLVQATIDDPVRTVATRDTRYLPGGSRLDDPATAYYCRRGGYVVRNNRTGDIVQVSDRTDAAAWRAPWD